MSFHTTMVNRPWFLFLALNNQNLVQGFWKCGLLGWSRMVRFAYLNESILGHLCTVSQRSTHSCSQIDIGAHSFVFCFCFGMCISRLYGKYILVCELFCPKYVKERARRRCQACVCFQINKYRCDKVATFSFCHALDYIHILGFC